MIRTRSHANGRPRLGLEQLESREVPASLISSDPMFTVPSAGVVTFANVGPAAPAAVTPAANSTFVTHLYQDLLGRNADAAGLALWVNALNSGALSRAQVADGFQSSTEFRTDLITSYYTNILGRAPDAGGFNTFLGQLQAGVSRDSIRASFFGSQEFFNRVARDPTVLVGQLYAQILGRQGSAAEQLYWTSVMVQNGGDRTAVASLFLSSSEYQQNEVALAYSAFLHRQPDSQGFALWASQRAGGMSVETMSIQFMASDEYYNRL